MNFQEQRNETTTKEEKMKEVILIINKMIELSKPITYSKFNIIIPPENLDDLMTFKKENPEIGLATDAKENVLGISTLSIISTITNILVGDRLAFRISTGKEDEPPSGTIMGVVWYSKYLKDIDMNEKE